MRKLAIIGSGDLGQLIAYHATLSNEFEVVGFFDDLETKGNRIDGFEVLGAIKEIESLHNQNGFY